MYRKRKIIGLTLAAILVAATGRAQRVLDLDSCRALAMRNNKTLQIAQEKIGKAEYDRKAARTNYLPNFSATGTYMRFNKEISLLSDDQKAAFNGLGTNVAGQLQTSLPAFLQQLAAVDPQLAQFVQQMAASGQISSMAGILDGVGQKITDALRTDTRNMWAGAVTMTQPLYMGGKIRAYNKITDFAKELAESQHTMQMQEVILSTDEAYWMAVSLRHKKRLAESYLALVQKLDDDINKMMREGVATKADELTVRVKVNEAEMTLTQVEDGLSLSKMLLCQLCGLPIETEISLVDEEADNLIQPIAQEDVQADVQMAFNNRPELNSLELATHIYDQKANVTRAEFLPTLALTGNYLVTNPSVLNGFEKKFRGMWNVGVILQIPIFHWGEGNYKMKAARAETNIARLELSEAKEKIELQVNQSTFKVKEANKRLAMAQKNMEKAEENLRYANLSFAEGVASTTNVLEAQTAWRSAQADKIDAEVDVRLTQTYLQKALGTLR